MVGLNAPEALIEVEAVGAISIGGSTDLLLNNETETCDANDIYPKRHAWRRFDVAGLGLPRRWHRTFRLGLIDMYGGNFAGQANAIRLGMQIALDEANAAGVVKGHKLALTSADMGTSVEKAITEARRMILDDKLHYVVVGSHSGAAVALADFVRDKDVFGLGCFRYDEAFHGRGRSCR